MKTLTDKYKLLLEEKFSREQFLRDARLECPDLITRHNTIDDAITILLNKGLISEGKAKSNDIIQPIDKFPAEAVERGIDVELENMGLDSVEVSSEEEYNKAMDKALKNLEKDFNFYLHKLSDTKVSKKRTDILIPAEKSNTVDKDNKMTVVKESINKDRLAEQLLKENIKEIIKNILNPSSKTLVKESDQSTREMSFKVKNTLNSVLPVIDDLVDFETIDPEFIDQFMDNLQRELDSRLGEKENLFSEPLSERKRFTYEGKII